MPVTVYVTHVQAQNRMPTGNTTGAGTPWAQRQDVGGDAVDRSGEGPIQGITSFAATPEVQVAGP